MALYYKDSINSRGILSNMGENFESQKNIKASSYTALICILLLVIFIFVKWTLPEIPPPPMEEGIEVNLGNSDMGMGEDQPFLPGQPSPQDQQSYTPPKQSAARVDDNVKDFETDDKDEDAPVVAKPPVTKPDATRVPEKDLVKSAPVKNPQPVNEPAPAPPKPKAVFKGVNGTGTGGNEADEYKKGGNQGVAGGSGDQGRPGGNPDSDNYTGGGTGNGLPSVLKGLQGRRVINNPSFEDEFNENAKVAVDIKVDASGKVISATYQPRGSTTAQSYYKEVAIKNAMKLKYNSTGQESVGTIQFNFRVTN